MPQVLVTLKKQEFVEYVVSHLIEVSDADFKQMQDRPLQAKFWAEHVAPYRIEKDAWKPIDNGRKTVSIQALEVEMHESVEPA